MAAIETGCPYTLSVYLNGAWQYATFNVPTDPNFVGYLDTVTGLDMYGVRENAQVLSASDGGYHGSFWRDRRPFTLGGFVFPSTPALARSAAQNKLEGVVGACMRQDGYCLWTPSDGIQRGIPYRCQQPVRVTAGQSNQQKKFLVSGVCADWRILTWAGSSGSSVLGSGALPLGLNVTSNGNADAAPVITVTGPINTPVIQNNTSGKKITFTGSLSAGQTLQITLPGSFPNSNPAITYPVVTVGGIDWSQYVDPLNSDYTLAVVAGANAWQLGSTSAPGSYGTSSATALALNWNDSWH